MQNTGLIIKVSLALGGLMGAAYAHSWSAHHQTGTSANQVQVMAGGMTGLPIAPETDADPPAAEDKAETSTAAPANVHDTADSPIIPHAAQDKVESIFQDTPPSAALGEVEGNANHSAEGTSAPLSENMITRTDPEASPASFQNNNTVKASIEMKTNASPVPETSTSVGFGGMLAMGIGFMAVRRWKLARQQ